MLSGGLRSLYLQALHPAAIAGVMEHSSFRTDPWGRLWRTAEFVGVTSFAATGEVHAAAARVRQIHAPLRGVVPTTGLPYRVSDPHLLRWVHISEIASFVSVALRSGLRLPDSEVDAYIDEQRQIPVLLGCDPDELPASRAELAACFASYLPELQVTPHALEAARFVLSPPVPVPAILRPPARLGWTALAALACASLPSWARSMYAAAGLTPALPRPLARASGLALDLTTTAMLTATYVPLRALPEALSVSPHERAARVRISS